MKVKVCTLCKTYNPESALYCRKPGCGEPLPPDSIIEINAADYPSDEEINPPRIVPEGSDSVIRLDDEQGEKSPEAIKVKGEKKRHGCLTAWFVLFFIFVLGASIGLISGSTQQKYASMPTWAFLLMIIDGIIYIVSAIALFKWKKWGFYLYILYVIVYGINFLVYNANHGHTLGYYFLLLVYLALPIGILYGVLHIGNENNKGWPQLE